MIISKKFEGEVDHNNGEFAEVKTNGIEGIEEGLWLGTMQIHRDTEETRGRFLQRFPVGMRLEIVTTTEIKPMSQSAYDLDLQSCRRWKRSMTNFISNRRKSDSRSAFWATTGSTRHAGHIVKGGSSC